MKHLQLETLIYRISEKSYTDRLKTLGYSESGIYYMPLHIREFLHFTENKGITNINDITSEHINNYINYLKNRKNQRRTGGLSFAHINKQISAINNFARYLKETQTGDIPANTPCIQDKEAKDIKILSPEDIKKLYRECENNLFGLRDRVMLSIYYGCGLRKKEGINLEIPDILFEKKLVHVRKSKTGRERLVPMTAAVMSDLENYIALSRPILLNSLPRSNFGGRDTETALFISQRAKRISGASMIVRLKKLIKKAEINPPGDGHSKEPGLHTLRHSIATHLLQKGMKLEDISKFLGHQSLDSTQIYTHIVNEL